jgi:hypothetical protein
MNSDNSQKNLKASCFLAHLVVDFQDLLLEDNLNQPRIASFRSVDLKLEIGCTYPEIPLSEIGCTSKSYSDIYIHTHYVMYKYIYTYTLYTLYTYMSDLCIYVYIYMATHIYIYVCMHAFLFTMCLCACVHVLFCMFMYTVCVSLTPVRFPRPKHLENQTNQWVTRLREWGKSPTILTWSSLPLPFLKIHVTLPAVHSQRELTGTTQHHRVSSWHHSVPR